MRLISGNFSIPCALWTPFYGVPILNAFTANPSAFPATYYGTSPATGSGNSGGNGMGGGGSGGPSFLHVKRVIPTRIQFAYQNNTVANTTTLDIEFSYDSSGTILGPGLVDYAAYFSWLGVAPSVSTLYFNPNPPVNSPAPVLPYSFYTIAIGEITTRFYGQSLITGSCPTLKTFWQNPYDFSGGGFANTNDCRITDVSVLSTGSIY